MREFCLVTMNGTVVNMCMTYKPTDPEVTEFQKSRGYRWVPLSQVSESQLRDYRYYYERPGR